jgi:hypothetical protein
MALKGYPKEPFPPIDGWVGGSTLPLMWWAAACSEAHKWPCVTWAGGRLTPPVLPRLSLEGGAKHIMQFIYMREKGGGSCQLPSAPCAILMMMVFDVYIYIYIYIYNFRF